MPEIIDYFEANYTEPVWAIGHSFGAVILAFAAEQRPDLFKGLIMMDPPVLSRKIRWAIAISQFLGVSHKIMPLAKKQQIDLIISPQRPLLRKSYETNLFSKILVIIHLTITLNTGGMIQKTG